MHERGFPIVDDGIHPDLELSPYTVPGASN